MVERLSPIIECLKSVMPSRMKGKSVVWWMSFNIVGLWWYAMVFDKTLDGSIATIYIAALGFYSGTKSFEHYQNIHAGGRPDVPTKPEDPPGGYK